MPKLLEKVLTSLFSKPSTILYPFENPGFVEGTRGELSFDMNKCDQCQDCERICPAGAITVDPEAKRIEWDPFKCIYCHLCVRNCMHGAISGLENVEAPDYKKKVKIFE